MHGDVHQRILEVTRAIQAHPDSLLLYQIRGELYLLHEAPDSAYADFNYCRSRQYRTPRVYFGLSQCAAIAPDSALYFVDQALISEPGLNGALEWKARLLLLLHRPCEAAGIYDQIIHTSIAPSPALYMDASRSWDACSGVQAHPHAIRVLEEGLTRLGPVLVLQKELVQEFLKTGAYPQALEIQNQIVQQASQQAKPLMTRAAIHSLMGNPALAKTDLASALVSLDQMPAYRSGTPAMQALRENILSLLNDAGK